MKAQGDGVPVVVGEGPKAQKLGPKRPPPGCRELIDDERSLGVLQGVDPVYPHHPRMHGCLGDDEAPHHHDCEQREGPNGVGHDQVTC